MRLFYCPVCGKEQIADDRLYRNERTIINCRDGFGRVITHYKCECGNYLAGSMDIAGYEDHMVQYCKDIIKGYNKGGCFFDHNVSLSGDNSDLFESAKQCYEKRKKDAEEKTEKFLKEIHWYEQCDRDYDDKCEHIRCKYAKFISGEDGGVFCNRNDVIKD